MTCSKIGYGSKLLLLLSCFMAGLLSASYGHPESQTVNATGVTVIQAYKVPTGEETGPAVSEPVDSEQDNVSTQNMVPPQPKCQEPEYGDMVPFPGAMVNLDTAFLPIKGRAKWLPKDPGPAGKTSIEGIDTDGDCVRDDIEIFIATKYPNSDQQMARKYLFEFAKYLGLFLHPDLTRTMAGYYAQKMYISTECARRELKNKPTTRKELDMIFAKFHNTLDRSYRYIHNNELLGGSSSQTPDEIDCAPEIPILPIK